MRDIKDVKRIRRMEVWNGLGDIRGIGSIRGIQCIWGSDCIWPQNRPNLPTKHPSKKKSNHRKTSKSFHKAPLRKSALTEDPSKLSHKGPQQQRPDVVRRKHFAYLDIYAQVLGFWKRQWLKYPTFSHHFRLFEIVLHPQSTVPRLQTKRKSIQIFEVNSYFPIR